MENAVYDEKLHSYQGTVAGSEVILYVHVAQGGLEKNYLSIDEMVKRVMSALPNIKEKILQEMFTIALDWNSQSEESKVITEEEFSKALDLYAIGIYPNLDYYGDLWFKVGDFFLDHDIEVRIDKNILIKEVCLAG